MGLDPLAPPFQIRTLHQATSWLESRKDSCFMSLNLTKIIISDISKHHWWLINLDYIITPKNIIPYPQFCPGWQGPRHHGTTGELVNRFAAASSYLGPPGQGPNHCGCWKYPMISPWKILCFILGLYPSISPLSPFFAHVDPWCFKKLTLIAAAYSAQPSAPVPKRMVLKRWIYTDYNKPTIISQIYASMYEF